MNSAPTQCAQLHNTRHRRYAVAIAVAALVGSTSVGCSSSDSPSTSTDANSDVPPDPNRKLCSGNSGTTDIRFAAQTGSVGMASPGNQVLVENGYDFLAISDQCQYWVLTDKWADVRTGMLSPSQTGKLQEDLRIDNFPDYVGDYTIPLCDGPWYRFRLGSEMVRIASTCFAANTSESVMWLRDKVRDTEKSLHEDGTPIDGPVRFMLIVYPDWVGSNEFEFRNAPLWPLSTPPSEFAILEHETYDQAGHWAVGDDADALRAIAVAFRNKEIGALAAGYAPVLDSEGTQYGLFVRDTVPFENSEGLWE
ncbi:MAG: hypothetical protein FWD57_02470 [Polyangiaceae bacterium]|nr:hypothetical protein [Polyangiaceae bacterium]